MSHKHSEPPAASTHLKLYQAFIFSVPILSTFVLLIFFYLFYLRRRRVAWSSLRMRNHISTAELGLKKEFREMLPIIIYKESFSVKDTQCSVCLGDYQAEDKLQQIPSCGHTFHMNCIDHWLAIHSICPLCRLSLLASAEPSPETRDDDPSVADSRGTPLPQRPHQNSEETQTMQEPNSRNDVPDEERGSQPVDHKKETEKKGCGFSGNGKLFLHTSATILFMQFHKCIEYFQMRMS